MQRKMLNKEKTKYMMSLLEAPLERFAVSQA